jgi:hypothetical protein
MAGLVPLGSIREDGLNLLRFIPGYEENVVLSGKEPLLLLLLAFLITFTVTRFYTRLARFRGWGSGSVHGVHLHHNVVGIVMVLVSGLLAIALDPSTLAREGLAIVFGAGAALTLDEFALSLYLKDVYWSPEGRASIDATIMGVMLGGLLLVGTSPLGIEEADRFPRMLAFAVIALNVVAALVTFLKGRLALGLVSIFIPLVGLVCAVRLAKPGSPWARRFYGDAEHERARRRFEVRDRRLEELKMRLYDLIGGAPARPAEAEQPAGLPRSRGQAGSASIPRRRS